ncbi:MAG TPA: hypothetical protein VM425_02925 [Myxococcota bacterium]|nr:hypothetical protein [Myxococcota bacterium]
MEQSTFGRLELDTERNRAARRRSEDALVALLHELGDFDPPLIVLGGLVPDMLTRDQDTPVPKHLGTTDVDVLIDFQTAADADLSPIENALVRLGFAPQAGSDGWRWVGKIGGTPIKLEFLCELDNQPANIVIRPAGCKQLGAANLRGTGYVREDWTTEVITGTVADGKTATVKARFAGLCGYLLAKATAVRERGEEKDYYDFAYVLIYNRLGGPANAAQALQKSRFGDRLESVRLATVWGEIADRYGAPDRFGPAGYAAQSLQVDPASNDSLKRRDAVAAVREFLEGIGVSC